MRLLSRVVWHEGMYLAPHHFQAQSRYFEDTLHFASSALWTFGYGLTLCKLDHDALLSGAVSVLSAAGIFPDGLAFNIPSSDPPLPARSIATAFPPSASSELVYLALPANGAAGAGDPRYLREERTVADENNGADEQRVALGRKNFRIVLESERGEGLACLPLARIRRDGSGRFVYDPDYIPPCLQLTASSALTSMVSRLIGMLEDKSGAIRNSSPAGRGVAGLATRELASFWFLHTLHAAVPVLRNLLLVTHSHPEELYSELARLGGSLCSFALDSQPRDLPLYHHDDPASCFAALLRHIESHLNLILPVNCVSIPLERWADYFYGANVTDTRHLDASRWILGIESRAGEAEVITRTPRLVKVCSQRFVAELVRRAVPGLALTHLPAPPPSVPVRPEAQYFGVTKSGPCWDHIVQTRQVGVYVPGELPDPRLELLIVLE